jgi:hypothetical protein
MFIFCRLCKKQLLELIDQRNIEFHKQDIAPHDPRGITVAEIYMCRQCADNIIGKRETNDSGTIKRSR